VALYIDGGHSLEAWVSLVVFMCGDEPCPLATRWSLSRGYHVVTMKRVVARQSRCSGGQGCRVRAVQMVCSRCHCHLRHHCRHGLWLEPGPRRATTYRISPG
jgi:hypothetical protein